MSRTMRFAPVSSSPRGQRARANPLAASVLVHALLLVGVARWYHPVAPVAVREPEPGAEVVYLDFPSFDTQPAALPAGAGNAGPPLPAAATDARRPVVSPATGAPTATPSAPAAVSPVAATPGTSAAAVQPSAAGGAALSRWSVARDPRLVVGARGVPPTSQLPLRERMNADFAATARADSIRAADARRQDLARRQVTVFGRRVTVLGDSADAGIRNESIEKRRDVLTMHGDGRLWEQLQLNNQHDQSVRDSLFRARVRETRERNDAARRGRP